VYARVLVDEHAVGPRTKAAAGINQREVSRTATPYVRCQQSQASRRGVQFGVNPSDREVPISLATRGAEEHHRSRGLHDRVNAAVSHV
jgi:hypothetical protein